MGLPRIMGAITKISLCADKLPKNAKNAKFGETGTCKYIHLCSIEIKTAVGDLEINSIKVDLGLACKVQVTKYLCHVYFKHKDIKC